MCVADNLSEEVSSRLRWCHWIIVIISLRELNVLVCVS